ncbi:MAG TPA: ArsA-related P-loop ATPase [Anaeromyxobacteraceae bacterium]
MPPTALLDRRLVVVTGKGGVGKSTVAAALALLAARAGRRVLACELGAPERIAPLLGAPPAGTRAREALPGLSTVVVTPAEAMREYGLLVLRYRPVYEAVFENRVVKYFLRVVPSLAELVVLGKVLNEVRAEERGRRRWDLVILDAPSTGHAVQLLRTPGALVETVPAGPLRRDAQWMHGLLVDPAATALALVTLAEELPVNELVELDGELRALGMTRGALLVNAVPEPRFDEPERALLAAAEPEPAPLGPAARAAGLLAQRADEAARQVARLRAGVDLAPTLLPLVPAEAWGLPGVERIAEALAAGGAPWAR